jgi:nucleoside 2-deoxyribosyltransferase
MSTVLRCYVASPLGFTDAGRHYYTSIYLPALREVVEVIDPWAMTQPQQWIDAERDGTIGDLIAEVGARNIEAIRTADLLAANLDGQEVDSGTASEIGFATGVGVRCFGLRTDLRQSGEAGAHVNLQVEAFIVASGGSITGSLEELAEALRAASA